MHALNRHQFIGWTGRVGAAGADAAMESFFAMLQEKVRDRERWRTREVLRIAIITRVERPPTPPAGLGRSPPIDHEAFMNPVALAA